MKQSWRLLPFDSEDNSFLKMAKEEAIMKSVREKKVPPTLRFYSWNKPAVSLGYFQEAHKELNLDLCKKYGVEIFRRLTGGGAVYKSPNYELNYSLILREDEGFVPKDVLRSYELICSALIKGFKKKSLELKFKPINDLTLFGKKVSGNAQTRVNNVILQHGTILLKPEIDLMFKYLKIDNEILKKKKVESVKDLVTGVWNHNFIEKDEIVDSIVEGFEEIFNIEFRRSTLTQEEEDFAKELSKKYEDKDFVFWRS